MWPAGTAPTDEYPTGIRWALIRQQRVYCPPVFNTRDSNSSVISSDFNGDGISDHAGLQATPAIWR